MTVPVKGMRSNNDKVTPQGSCMCEKSQSGQTGWRLEDNFPPQKGMLGRKI